MWGAFAIRFEGNIPSDMFTRLVLLWPYVVALQTRS